MNGRYKPNHRNQNQNAFRSIPHIEIRYKPYPNNRYRLMCVKETSKRLRERKEKEEAEHPLGTTRDKRENLHPTHANPNFKNVWDRQEKNFPNNDTHVCPEFVVEPRIYIALQTPSVHRS